MFPAIGSLDDAGRHLTHAVTIAPGLFMQLLPDSVIAVSWSPASASSIRVKRHRLYPQATLDRDDFVELHTLKRQRLASSSRRTSSRSIASAGRPAVALRAEGPISRRSG